MEVDNTGLPDRTGGQGKEASSDGACVLKGGVEVPALSVMGADAVYAGGGDNTRQLNLSGGVTDRRSVKGSVCVADGWNVTGNVSVGIRVVML